MIQPPYAVIRDALHAGRVIPFLGAGASLERDPEEKPWKPDGGLGMPLGRELAEHLARRAEFPSAERKGDLPVVAQFYEMSTSREFLERDLHTIFTAQRSCNALHDLLASVEAPMVIVTTNYDDLVERRLRDAGRRVDVVVHSDSAKHESSPNTLLWWKHGEEEPVAVLSKDLTPKLENTTVVYKMHGTVDPAGDDPDNDHFVISEDDYVKFMSRLITRSAIPNGLWEPFKKHPFLFIGYGLADWNFRVVLHRLKQDIPQGRWKRSWAFKHHPSDLEVAIWGSRELNVFNVPLETLVERLR